MKWFSFILLSTIAAPVYSATGEQLGDACRSVHDAQAIFIGQPLAPVSMKVSFEDRIEPARERWLQAKQEASDPYDTAAQIRLIRAFDEYDKLRIQYPPPTDMTLLPIRVETRFKGDVADVVYMQWPIPIKPDQPHLFFAGFMMESLDARFLRLAALPHSVAEGDAAVRVVRAATGAARGGVVLGSVVIESPSDPAGNPSPAGGFNVRVQAPGFVLDAVTDSEGAFMVTEVPSGPVAIHLALPERFTVVSGTLSATVEEGGCVPLNVRAALNGRIRGRIFDRAGKPKSDIPVQLLVTGEQRFATYERLRARTDANGQFEFRGLPPGRYFIGQNLYPESDVIVLENGKSPVERTPTFYPGTSDRNAAVPIVVGEGTDHSGLDFSLAW